MALFTEVERWYGFRTFMMRSWWIMNDKKQEIEACLEKFWDDMAIDVGEDPQDTGSLIGAPLDSLTVMEVMLEIDKLLNRKIPADIVIRKGGYESREQFVEQLTAEVLKYVGEHPDD